MSSLIIDILENNLGIRMTRVSQGSKEEWCGPCPVCGGDDRFRVWPGQEGGEAARQSGAMGRWWCRGCGEEGDVIQLLMFARGLEFLASCQELRIELSGSKSRRRSFGEQPRKPTWEPRQWPEPSEKWRSQAEKLVARAHEHLLEYETALKYLASRGLPLEAVRAFELGYINGTDKTGTCTFRPRSAFDLQDRIKDGRVVKTLWIPRGLTIPCRKTAADGGKNLHRVRIRRAAQDLKGKKDSKYLLLEGSGQAPMILPPTCVKPELAIWVAVEAELDAMAVYHACGGRVGVVASLTNVGKPDQEAHRFLSACPLILVALDFDSPDEKGRRPGRDGWNWWEKKYRHARRWPVPKGKDPGEAFRLGVDLAVWINDALPKPSVATAAGRPGNFQVGLTVGENEAEGKAPAVEPERVVTCRHDLVTYDLLLSDLPSNQPFYIVCGKKVVSLDSCLNCSGRPHGLHDLAVKMERACA